MRQTEIQQLDTTPRVENVLSDSEDDGDESCDQVQSSPEVVVYPNMMDTPHKRIAIETSPCGLTPVTARCIDFQQMGMTENEDIDEKKDELP
jgi:hypothetical protein